MKIVASGLHLYNSTFKTVSLEQYLKDCVSLAVALGLYIEQKLQDCVEQKLQDCIYRAVALINE